MGTISTIGTLLFITIGECSSFLTLKSVTCNKIIFFRITVCVTNAQRSIQWAGYQWFLRDQLNSGPGKY
jgi:hypothetical protein